MRVTVRLDDEQADHVDAMRQDDDASDAAAVRECIDRSMRLSEIETRRDDEVADLEAELEDLREELQAERDRAQKFAGKLDAKDETIRAKESHIDSLESTVYDQGRRFEIAADCSARFGRPSAAAMPTRCWMMPTRMGDLRARPPHLTASKPGSAGLTKQQSCHKGRLVR